MSIKEMDSKVMALRELQAEIERMTAEAEAIKDELKMQMIDQGTEVLTGTGWKASWKVVEGTRVDTKAMKAALPEIVAKYTIQTRTSRFCLN